MEAKEFRENIRNYNNTFAFTSLGVKIDSSVYGTNGAYTFRIQGELCPRISTLLPCEGDPPKFAQLYIYDSNPQCQAQMRVSHLHNKIDLNTVLRLQHMIEWHNPYVAAYHTAKERLDTEAHISLCLKAVDASHLDQCRHNHPTTSEVAIIMVGRGEDGATERDLVVQAHDGSFHSVSYLKSFYIPLRYPIPFVYGEQGWHPNIFLHDGYVFLSNLITTNSDRTTVPSHSNSPTKYLPPINSIFAQSDSTQFIVVGAFFKNIVSTSLHRSNRPDWHISE